MGKDERLEYLEEERRKIWARLTVIEQELKKKTSDYEAEAKISAANAELNAESIEAAKEKVEQNLLDLESKLTEVQTKFSDFDNLYNSLKSNSESSIEPAKKIKELSDELEENFDNSQSIVSELKKLADGKPALDESLQKLQEIYKRGDDYDSKLSALNKSITERKKEIDELYYDIIGFTEKGEDGEDLVTEGLKGELEKAYTSLQLEMSEASKSLEALKLSTENAYTSYSNERKKEYTATILGWKNEYQQVLDKIEALLPNALTTGLSYAYSEKKKTEETEQSKHRISFNYAIGGLVVISLIPFGISLTSLLQDVPLDQVILRVPRIVLAILPLYLPILWVAYSANRKMNLAKRLIEEYSHKEVLSKTFEGLSKQINSVEDKEISGDLKVRLLYNILEVNSENPGKLISDYNKSDHPLMDALDKSVKLTNAVTRLAKIPGFSKLAASLERRSEEILEKENEKAEAALKTVETQNPKTRT
jgi:hypothetical protein